jgi:TolA-binding protein
MLAMLLATLLSVQDGEVDRILVRFQQRREKARTDGEFRRLLADARLELENFLRDNPKHSDAPRAAFQVAETYLSARDYERAAEKLRAYLKDYPTGTDAPSARFALAEIQLEHEKDADARAAFEEFAKLYPGDDRTVFARMYIAVSLQNERRYDEAAELLKTVRQDYRARRESWGAQMQLAIVYHVQEKNADARRTLEEIVRDCPDKEPVEIARRHLVEYLKIGQDAPGFPEKDLEGKLRGKVVVVYFFDPSLTTAISEASFLRKARDEAAKAGRAEDLQIVGISIGSERKDVGIYKAEAQADWNLLFDGRGIDGRFARLYDVRGLPALSLIDRKGKVRFFNVAGRDFRNCVTKLLEEK